MKLSTLLLAGSLATNTALFALMIAGASSHSASDEAAAPAASASATPAGVAGEPDPALWKKAEGDDWTALIANLRAMGFPPSVIRAILGAQVGESFRARRKALEASAADTPFWKNPVRDPKTQAALRELTHEEQKILKDLFAGDSSGEDPMANAYLERRMGNVPAEKRDQLAQILKQFDDRRSDIYAAVNGGMGGSMSLLPDEREKLNQLDKAQHAEIAQLLTPQELEDYDLRSSSTAEMLRYQLTAFNATEDEFRTLYKLQSAFDEQFGRSYGPSSPDEMRTRMAAQADLQKQIAAALGPDRFADYQRATDYGYRQVSAVAARLELPPEAANQVFAVQKDIQQRSQALYSDRTLAPDDRNAQLAALATEATTKVTAALGSKGLEAYKLNGGQWLQNLVPRQMPARR